MGDDGSDSGAADGPIPERDDREVTDGGVVDRTPEMPLGLPRWVVGLVPLVLLAIMVAGVFVGLSASPLVQSGEPLPDVTITGTNLPDQETIVLTVTNNGPDAVTISQVLVDEAYWSWEMPGQPDDTLGAGESARLEIPYHWTEGFDYEVVIVLDNGATFHHTIVAAQETPGFGPGTLGSLALAGLFVGVIPVALGMLWFPFLRTMSDRNLHAVLAFSAGVLGFLAIDGGFEALELGHQVPGFFEGPILVVGAALGTLLLVQSVSAWREGRAAEGDERASSGLWVAYLVAVGIGLHNLAEGLAIGSSFALGRASLGAFLLIGFMVHNVTEGPAVVAPVARGERPSFGHFAAIGLIAGAPVILGGWIGGLAFSPTLGALFLAIGVGAILQVVWEIGGMVERQSGRIATAPNLLAFLVGLVVMYGTDLLVVL